MIVYKKCRAVLYKNGIPIPTKRLRVIVTLSIPARAKVVEPIADANYDGKCRASSADVIDIRFLNNHKPTKKCKVTSIYSHKFEYKIGKRVRPQSKFDPNPEYCCGSGIHFFKSRQAAKEYML